MSDARDRAETRDLIDTGIELGSISCGCSFAIGLIILGSCAGVATVGSPQTKFDLNLFIVDVRLGLDRPCGQEAQIERTIDRQRERLEAATAHQLEFRFHGTHQPVAILVFMDHHPQVHWTRDAILLFAAREFCRLKDPVVLGLRLTDMR